MSRFGWGSQLYGTKQLTAQLSRGVSDMSQYLPALELESEARSR